MALEKVKVIDGWLTSTLVDGHAISEPYAVSAIKETRSNFMDFHLAPIVSHLFPVTAGTFKTQIPIAIGDKIIVVLNDDSVQEVTVDNVTEETITANLVPIMTSNTEPYGVADANYNVTGAYRAFDRNDGTFGLGGSGWLTYEFLEPVLLNHIIVKGNVSVMFEFSGSNDGVTWTILIVNAEDLIVTNVTTQLDFDFINTEQFRYYRVRSVGGYALLYTLELIGSVKNYIVDTSSITGTETVSRVYIERENLYQNDTQLVPSGKMYRPSTTDDRLVCRKDFADVVFPLPVDEIITKVDIYTPRTRVIRVSSRLHN